MPFPVADGALPFAVDYNDVMVDALEVKQFVPRLDSGTEALNLGNPSTQLGRVYRFGIFTWLNVFLRFGTTGATFGAGDYRVHGSERMPGNASPLWDTGQPLDQFVVGGGSLFDASTGIHHLIEVHVDAAHFKFVADSAPAAWVAYNQPFVWAGGDYLMFWAIFERSVP